MAVTATIVTAAEPSGPGARPGRAPAARAVQLFLLRKLLSAAATLVLLTAIVFLLIKLIPGDDARAAAGESATPEQVSALRHELGLDRPLPGQYLSFLGRLLHGNLGTSISSQQPIREGIAQVLPQTLELVVLAMILMIAVIVPLATMSAVAATGRADTTARLGVVLAAAMPSFWLALVLQFVLGSQLKLLPISGRLSRGIAIPERTGSALLDSLLAGDLAAWWDALQHLILPAIVLSLPFAAQLFRALRTDLIRVLAREHLTVARAKGISDRRLVLRHALPNAAGPALTILGVQFGAMVGAAVLVESVFGLVGLGSYLTNAVAQKDTFAVLGGVLVIGALVVVTSFVVDVLHLIRDPRIRAGQLGGFRS